MIEPPQSEVVAEVLDGPVRVRGELRWRTRLDSGGTGVLAMQVPELARSESLRRRFVYETERRAGLAMPGLAAQLAYGPLPDPRDPQAPPPWRLRVEPDGESLEAWLARRAPAPVDEAIELVAAIADVVHRLHGHGVVARDLEPRSIVLSTDGPMLTDIGLARVDILSTRTASSLMLEGSPYAAPEHLRATLVDHRADLFTLGVILWHALTGGLPWDGPALFRDTDSLPMLNEVRAEVPVSVARIVRDCLVTDPTQRLESAADLRDRLLGSPFADRQALVRLTCQACGQPLRAGLRLCLHCGKQAVQFEHAPEGEAKTWRLVLTRASEKVEFHAKLRSLLETLGEGEAPELHIIIGDARLYSKEEQKRYKTLPLTLFSGLRHDTGEALLGRFRDAGFKVKLAPDRDESSIRRHKRVWVGLGGVFATAGLISGIAVAAPLAIAGLAAGGVFVGVGHAVAHSLRKNRPVALTALRKAPAALPASDPLVAILAERMSAALAPDVREQLTEIAILVQRLCDHRASLAGEDADFARVTEPAKQLALRLAGEIDAVARCDRALAELDEGMLVRAIARSEARQEEPALRHELLVGLDRLRQLEDRRAAHMQRLLEASSLLRRTTELGLATRGEARDDDAQLALARALLEAEISA